MYRKSIAVIVAVKCFLSAAALAQSLTRDAIKLRIEPLAVRGLYSQDASLPIRCRFINISERPAKISLPDDESKFGLLEAPLGLEVKISRSGKELTQVFQGLNLKSLDFCKQTSEKLDSDVKCEPLGTPTTLRPGDELVRTVDARLYLGGLREQTSRTPPGEYKIQVISRQADFTLVSNEVIITIAPNTSETK